MKRRGFIQTAPLMLSALAAQPRLAAASLSEGVEVSVWHELQPGVSTKLAGAAMKAGASAGLLRLPKPLTCRLPSGLSLEVMCERIPTGEFHLSVTEGGRFASMGKYAGFLAVRYFPAGHSSYVINVDRPGKRHGE